MPTDPRKRQKKLEQKSARRKEKKHISVRAASIPLAARFTLASAYPILDSCIGDTCWDQGIGQAILSRVLPNGQIAVGIFLVDVFCLGVKSTIAEIVPRAEYNTRFAPDLPGSPPTTPYPPEAVRKFVEGVVEYAKDSGFLPDADYEVGKLIFGTLDPDATEKEFEYGKNGKPFYINGPYESQSEIREILATLDRTRGEGGYEHLRMTK